MGYIARMNKRGRKSAASVAVAATATGKRASPPDKLSYDEAAVWKATVATKPADWFTPDSYPLLVAYCRHVVRADYLDSQLKLLPDISADPTVFETLQDLLKMFDAETRAVATMARHMRLTQQSRVRAENAATAHSNTAAKKPWDVE